MPDLGTTTIVFDIDQRRSREIDAIGQATTRDRAAVIGEAIDAYLELHRCQIGHVEEGLRQAEAGDYASPEDVAAFFAQKA